MALFEGAEPTGQGGKNKGNPKVSRLYASLKIVNEGVPHAKNNLASHTVECSGLVFRSTLFFCPTGGDISYRGFPFPEIRMNNRCVLYAD